MVDCAWWGSWPPPQRPGVMSDVDEFTAIATHGEAKAYMMKRGNLVEFGVGDDGTGWVEVGEVSTSM